MRADLAYPSIAKAALDRIQQTQGDAIEAAAKLVVASFERGGILQAYGTGHSRIVTLELAGRAGGLANIGMLAVKDLVMFGDASPNEILDATYERESGLASQVYELAQPRPEDAFLIVSNSGINAAIVEMARLARDKGHPIVAITSVQHTNAVASRDGGRARLVDYADIVIDNAAPPGDAAIQLAPGMCIGALSSLTGVFIAQMLTERICRILLSNGRTPPVYISANLPHGDAHNSRIQTAYAGRVRTIEP